LLDYIDFSRWFNTPALKAGISTRDMDGSNSEIRQKMIKKLQLNSNGICTANQTHSSRVYFTNQPCQNQETDGFISNRKDIVLTIKIADCIPLFLYDRTSDIIGMIHSGWRGTVGQIAINSIKQIIQNGGNLSEIQALVGPSICKKHFEVREDIVSQFPSKFVDTSEFGTFNVDLKAMVTDQLISMGLNSKLIFDVGLCTHCREDLFYSYRRDKRLKGRMIAVIGLMRSKA